MNISHAYPFIAFAAIAASVVGIVVYLNYKRRTQIAALAASIGLLFSKEGPAQAELEATGLEIFKRGHSRKASNMIKTSASAGQFAFFDYGYTTGGGRNSTAHRLTLALIECSCLAPNFDLKPESFIYKVGEMIGFKDIDLPAFPLFSDKYRLTGADEAAVRMFFNPERAAWFERNLGLRVQGSGKYFVFFKREGHLPVSGWPAFIEEAKIFAAEALK